MTTKVFAILILLVVFVSGCTGSSDEITGDVALENSSELPIITLNSENALSPEECSSRDLSNKVLFIVSAYCPHCKEALPHLQEAADEKGVDILVLDASDKEDMKTLLNFGISVRYTPTLISGCSVYIGDKSEEEYTQILDESLEN